MGDAAASYMGSGSAATRRPSSGAKGTGTAWLLACAAPAPLLPLGLSLSTGLRPAHGLWLALLGASLLLAAGALALWRAARSGAPLDTRANRVTLLRLSVVTGLAALTAAPAAFAPWPFVLVSVACLVLDGFDGRLARKDGDASAFGAWFDQETDALFVMVLSALLWQLDRAGAWVLAAGAWRYAFLAAIACVPRLRGELAFSRRRRVVCVVLLTSLIVCLSPLPSIAVALGAPRTITDAAFTALAALAVALVSLSFVVDLARLWTADVPPRSQPPVP